MTRRTSRAHREKRSPNKKNADASPEWVLGRSREPSGTKATRSHSARGTYPSEADAGHGLAELLPGPVVGGGEDAGEEIHARAAPHRHDFSLRGLGPGLAGEH